MRSLPAAPLLLSAILLSACGGGGGSSIVTPPPPPANPGARIVFERQPTPGQSDLYLIREDGSGEVALANSADREGFLAFTRDGRMIYERNAGPPSGTNQLFSVRLDGTGPQRLSPADVDAQFYGLTATNKVIFYTSTPQLGAAINAVNTDGTQRVVLSDTTDREEIVGLTASGRVVYRTSNDTSAALNSIRTDGTGRVTFDKPVDATDCDLSGASGDKLVLDCYFLNRGGDVFVVSETGGALTPIATDLALNEYLMQVTKSGQLVIARHDEPADQIDFYLANTAGGALVPLATSPAKREIPFASTLDRVLYVAYDTPNALETKSVRLDGTGMVLLTPSATEPLSFRHQTSSEKHVFQWFRSATRSDLLAINADGTGAITLASNPGDDNFLAADDSRVVYQTVENNQQVGVSSVNLATGASVLLVPAGSELRYAELLPSGRVLLHKAGIGAAPDDDIFIVNADGTGTRPLAQTPGRENVLGIAP